LELRQTQLRSLRLIR